jgi:hypothetical protein
MTEVVNLKAKLATFETHWDPKIVGELNGQHVRLAKFQGEFIIVPRGVEHCPSAEEEVHILLFEPAATRNTGNVGGPRTVSDLEKI